MVSVAVGLILATVVRLGARTGSRGVQGDEGKWPGTEDPKVGLEGTL